LVIIWNDQPIHGVGQWRILAAMMWCTPMGRLQGIYSRFPRRCEIRYWQSWLTFLAVCSPVVRMAAVWTGAGDVWTFVARFAVALDVAAKTKHILRTCWWKTRERSTIK
jgi:hypothetical protein